MSILFKANGRTFYRVPFRAGVYSSPREWLLGIFWCHVVRRLFPTASAMCLALVLLSGCVPASYAKQLDQCAFDNVGNRPAIAQCQCQVSQSYGRSCDWLKAVVDGGVE